MNCIDLVHVIHPRDFFVAPDVVLGWAHDALIDESVNDHINAHGPVGEAAHTAIVASVNRPTDLEEAKTILDDLGTYTFAKS